MKKHLVLFVIAIVLSFLLKAQNYSGHYTMQSKEMIDGKEYLNAIAQEITVAQTKDSIKIVRLTPAGGDQLTTSTITLPLNNTNLVTIITNRKRTLSAGLDKANNMITLVSTYSYENKPDEIEYKNTEVWMINNDGTLTITKTSDAAVTDDWTIKAIFKKQ